jgi:hypothetical protein
LTPRTSILLALALAAPPVLAEEPAEPAEAAATPRAADAPSPPALDLDRLLRVPAPEPRASTRRGGRARDEWESAFAEGHAEVRELEQRIAANQRKLRESTGDDWSFSPAGAGQPADPAVLQIRAELRRDRQSLETARERLRDLEVEASLAGVPDAWRDEP